MAPAVTSELLRPTLAGSANIIAGAVVSTELSVTVLKSAALLQVAQGDGAGRSRARNPSKEAE